MAGRKKKAAPKQLSSLLVDRYNVTPMAGADLIAVNMPPTGGKRGVLAPKMGPSMDSMKMTGNKRRFKVKHK